MHLGPLNNFGFIKATLDSLRPNKKVIFSTLNYIFNSKQVKMDLCTYDQTS